MCSNLLILPEIYYQDKAVRILKSVADRIYRINPDSFWKPFDLDKKIDSTNGFVRGVNPSPRSHFESRTVKGRRKGSDLLARLLEVDERSTQISRRIIELCEEKISVSRGAIARCQEWIEKELAEVC